VKNTLSQEQIHAINAYWRAANYLSVGQIYLRDNPLLREPLKIEHVKPRLLGHWGTTPGLNFIYAHVNRLIQKHDLSAIPLVMLKLTWSTSKNRASTADAAPPATLCVDG
jgi:xylulose-5-phosphate/fructose-6-phosphate phosphoketolase